MRKFWFIGFLFIFLAACGTDEQPTAQPDTTVQATCSRPALAKGARGTHVKFAQQRLLTKGNRYTRGTPAYYIRTSGGADGIFGEGTRKAVIAFQKMAFGPGSYPGIIGPKTWAKLGCSSPPSSRAALAQQIQNSSRIELLPYSPISSGRSDGADARSNIRDTAAGRPAKRSSYGNAPGRSVYLDIRMLRGMRTTANHYSFRVTSIAGGSHSSNSRHYAGISFDADIINGRRVRSRGADSIVRGFMQTCRNLGATQVLGPGNAGHSGHVHCAWSR